ncbi:MAG: tetratricopeptide repeat protein [Deltaproteobacteria bacterium]|jgi:tetratricopeptide (TPR) repeat protein|nr:tetratricopeptide repeat protein [Deltaproteobacteria bacterium]
MNLRLTLAAIVAMVAFFILSCTREPYTGKPADARPRFSYKSDNQYYYFIEAQIQRNQRNLDRAVILLNKALELDSDSLYLQRELATVYLQNKEDEKALKLLENLLKNHPNDVRALILYGGIKQVRKDNTAAAAAYEKVIELDPQQERVYSLLGNIYMDTGNLERAEAIFNQLIDHFPDSYAGHYYLGKIYAKQNKLKEAEAELLKTLELAPDLLEPRFELLKLYKATGREDEIVKLYQDILNQNPNNIRAALELGLYYHENGDQKAAEEIFVKLGHRSRTEFEVLVQVIQVYVDQKKYDEALVVLQGMLKAVADSSDIHHVTGIAFYSKNDFDSAVKHFTQVMPDSRFYQDAVVHAAYIYQEKGETEKAIAHLSQASASQPKNAEFKYYIGTFYEDLERYEEAVEHIQAAIELEPDNARYYFRLGVIYDKWDNKEASMEMMRKVIALDPKHANALNYLGYTYADLGQNLDEAELLIKEALKYKPNDGYITDSLGWVYYKKGEFEKAIKYLTRAVELVPDDPIMLEHLGDAYLKVNDKANALKYYQKSLMNKEEDKDKEALQKKIRELSGNDS